MFGVVGVVIILCSTLNSTISGSLGRFYAFAIGENESKAENVGVRECCEWFNVGLVVNTFVPSVLVVLGYFGGHWAVENYFIIPVKYIAERRCI